MKAARTGAGLGLREVRGIRPDDEAHMAGVVTKLGGRVSGGILKKVLDSMVYVSSGLGKKLVYLG